MTRWRSKVIRLELPLIGVERRLLLCALALAGCAGSVAGNVVPSVDQAGAVDIAVAADTGDFATSTIMDFALASRLERRDDARSRHGSLRQRQSGWRRERYRLRRWLSQWLCRGQECGGDLDCTPLICTAHVCRQPRT